MLTHLPPRHRGGVGRRLLPHTIEMQEDRVAFGGDAVATSTSSDRAPSCILKWLAVDEHVVQLDVGQVARAPRLELVLDLLADAAHHRLGHGRVRAQRLAQRRFDVAIGQRTDPPGDHQALGRVGAGDVLASSREPNVPSVPRTFGRDSVIGPGVVLMSWARSRCGAPRERGRTVPPRSPISTPARSPRRRLAKNEQP